MKKTITVLSVFGLSLLTIGTCGAAGSEAVHATGKTYKVADLFKNKDSLDKQKVTVKGKVVKVASDIMNKNWIHIQDGSGKASAKNNDITVTTSQPVPPVGKVVTVTGTLYKNKDFGAGYYYDAIIEQATVK